MPAPHRLAPIGEPVDLDEWRNYVLPAATLNARTRSQHSFSVPSLEALGAGPVLFSELAVAVARAAGE